MKSSPNQVFVKVGLDKNYTSILTSTDNVNSCDDHFLTKLIDNSKETNGLSNSTSWKIKRRYISEPLNVVNGSPKVDNPNGFEIEKSSTEEIVLDKPKMVKINYEKVVEIHRKGKSNMENHRFKIEKIKKEK